MAKTPDFINSVCRQWLFSPKGGIEGALLTVKGSLVQLSVAADIGVVLASGEFIHLRPHGMAQAGLGVGAKVAAVGERRLTVLGTPMLEAYQVNRIALA